MLNKLKHNKFGKYFIKVFAYSIVVALMIKFIPYRVTKPLPTWGELLCLYPLLFLIIFATLFFKEKSKDKKEK